MAEQGMAGVSQARGKQSAAPMPRRSKPISNPTRRRSGGTAAEKKSFGEVTDEEFMKKVEEWREESEKMTKDDPMYLVMMGEGSCGTCEARLADCRLADSGASCASCQGDEDTLFCTWTLEWIREKAGIEWDFTQFAYDKRLASVFRMDTRTGLRQVKRIFPRDEVKRQPAVPVVKKSRKPVTQTLEPVIEINSDDGRVSKPIAKRARKTTNMRVAGSVINLVDHPDDQGGPSHKGLPTAPIPDGRVNKSGQTGVDGGGGEDASSMEKERTTGGSATKVGLQSQRPTVEPEDDGHEMDVVDSVLRQEEGNDRLEEQGSQEKLAKSGNGSVGGKAKQGAVAEKGVDELASLREELDAADRKLREMAARCRAAEVEARKSKTELTNVQAKLLEGEQKQKEAEDELKKKATEWTKKRESMAEKLKNAETGLKSAEGTMETQRGELDVMRAKLRERTADKEGFEDTNGQTHAAMRATLDEKDKEISEARSNVTTLSAKLEELKREVDTMKAREARWGGEKQALVSMRENLEKTLDEVQENLTEEKKKVDGYRVVDEGIKQREAEDTATITRLEGQILGYKVAMRGDAWDSLRKRSKHFVESISRLMQVAARRFELNDSVGLRKYLELMRCTVADEIFAWEEGVLETGLDVTGAKSGSSKKRGAIEASELGLEESEAKRPRLDEDEDV